MDTFGWDTVYVLNVGRVNDVLAARQDQLITSFDIVDGGLRLEAIGEFSQWQITDGGSGDIVHLKLTIRGGTCTFRLVDPPRTVNLADVALVVAVQLQLLPQTNNSRLKELRFYINRVGEIGQVPAPGMISPVTLHDPSGQMNEVEQAVLMVALTKYIVANATQITFVLATINLVPPATNSWLTPVQSTYVYANRVGMQGALAILSATNNRDVSRLSRQIHQNLLRSSHEASYGISRELFLRHAIKPSLPAVFRHGTTDRTFEYRADSEKIVNTEPFNTDSVKEGLFTYYPKITRLSMTTNADKLESSYEGTCDIGLGIKMTFWVDTRNQVVYDAPRKALAFRQDPNPNSRYEADIPWWYYFLGVVTSAIIIAVAEKVAKEIANQLSAHVGAQTSIIRNPPVSIRWVGTEDLNVRHAAVDTGFYMQGNLRQ